MKTTELMIGDWVIDTYTNKPMRMSGVNSLMGEGLEPIPLTPEILEKNGFEKKMNDNEPLWSLEIGRFVITFDVINNGCPILTIEDVVDTAPHTCLILKDEVYNIHDLQHALRLCGIEKEITL